eukprot:GEMP01044728.1.p1 GENE.GEMP01044728.1~~GEMP01044728.1.p1  ORF type:complete len:287 (+),score=69.37 GEMP01044728.1:64-924(+)
MFIRRWAIPTRRLFSTAPSASLVKQLREITGSSMGKCRQALVEEGSDVEKAKQWLRQRNVQVARSKWESRETKAGLIAAQCSGTDATLVDFGAETDFATKSKVFQDMAVEVTQMLHGDPMANTQDKLVQVGGQVGERLMVERIAKVEGKCVAAYVHSAAAGERHHATLGTTAAAVAVEGESEAEVLEEFAKKIARHIVAYRPTYTREEDVPEAVLESERQIYRAQASDDDMSEANLEKKLTGKLQQFLSNEVLLRQSFLYDDKQSVGAILDKAKISVTQFSLLSRQ